MGHPMAAAAGLPSGRDSSRRVAGQRRRHGDYLQRRLEERFSNPIMFGDIRRGLFRGRIVSDCDSKEPFAPCSR